jgi:hypothetical protein
VADGADSAKTFNKFYFDADKKKSGQPSKGAGNTSSISQSLPVSYGGAMRYVTPRAFKACFL